MANPRDPRLHRRRARCRPGSELTGPRGPKPKRAFSRGNIILYGTLIVVALYYLLPLYVMIVTSLKGMPEIRMGNIFAPPLEVTFQPWVKAWAEACTGINCDGLSRGFWNSVRILIPSVILSIADRRRVNGYALSMWKFRGSEVFFTILMIGAFIPYQVMLYPIVILLREAGLYGSLAGLVLVHVTFGMPINTLLFRNYFASIPEELFKAARVDGAGFWAIFFRIMLPMSLPIFVVAMIIQVTGIWNDFLFGVVYIPAGPLPDDGAAQQHRQLGPGREGIQRQHGRDAADRPRPARHLLRLRQALRPRHRGRRGERMRHMNDMSNTASTSHSVEIRDLELAFGAVKVLQNLNLDIARRRVPGAAGSSGCGKSTLLNCIAGLLEIDRRADLDQGQERHLGRAQRTRHRHGVPVLRALPADDGARGTCPSA